MSVTKMLFSVLVFYLVKSIHSDLLKSGTSDGLVENYTIETHPNVELLPKDCGGITPTRLIYGGRQARPLEYPWMALISLNNRNFDKPPTTLTSLTPAINSRLLKSKKKKLSGIVLRSGFSHFDADAVGESGDLLTFKCGGSVINSRYILTAAHCVIDDQENIGVRVGEHDYSRGDTCQGEGENKICTHNYQDLDIGEIITHKGFLESNKRSHDIALLRLKKPLNFTKNIKPICLPVTKKVRNITLIGQNATVAGWGRTDTASSSSVLMAVKVPIQAECERSESDAVLCAGDYRKDSCSGDSGGPLMLRTVYENYLREIEFGIVSTGPIHCGAKDTYGIYTDVSKHMYWILDNIKP